MLIKRKSVIAPPLVLKLVIKGLHQRYYYVKTLQVTQAIFTGGDKGD